MMFIVNLDHIKYINPVEAEINNN